MLLPGQAPDQEVLVCYEGLPMQEHMLAEPLCQLSAGQAQVNASVSTQLTLDQTLK